MEQIQPGISERLDPGVISTNTKLSYEEFLTEYDGYYVEYVNSEVIGPMTVGLRHNELTGFLQSIFQLFVETRSLGRIFTEPFQMRMEFDDGVHGREPDLFFVKNENLVRLNDRFFDGGADLVIEVVSPDSIVRDTQDKFEEYQKAGVAEYWIIDPRRRTVNFYGLDANSAYSMLSIDSNGRFSSRSVEGLWIDTAWLWEEPLPNILYVLKEWGIV